MHWNFLRCKSSKILLADYLGRPTFFLNYLPNVLYLIVVERLFTCVLEITANLLDEARETQWLRDMDKFDVMHNIRDESKPVRAFIFDLIRQRQIFTLCCIWVSGTQ